MTAALTRVVLLSVALVALAVACESTDTPVDPIWGKQPCGHCGMIVGDPRTAAELVTSDGKRLFFDDIGCMVAYEHDPGGAPRHAWVHDADGYAWIDAQRAVYTKGEHTPMEFGYVAHATGPGAGFGDMRAGVLRRLAGEDDDDGRP